MRQFTFQYKTELELGIPVEQHDFVLRCMPASTPRQRVRCSIQLLPEVPFDIQRDSYGNPLIVGRIDGPHTSFSYEVCGTAVIDHSIDDVSEPHPLLLWQSPLTASSDEMLDLLTQAVFESARHSIRNGKGASTSPLHTCQLLMEMVADAMEYAPGSTTVKTTASEAFAQRKGVCQDFTHILISLMREGGVPAHYVSGLTLGEGATHAWAEAYLDGKWVGFDPTRRCMTDESYLVLATGRDWGDCPMERATFQGLASQSQSVFAQMKEVC